MSDYQLNGGVSAARAAVAALAGLMPKQNSLPFRLTRLPFERPVSPEQAFLSLAASKWVGELVDAVVEGKSATTGSGEPGVGKTVLLDVVVERLRSLGIEVIRAAAPLPSPLGFQHMIGDAAGVERSEASTPDKLFHAVSLSARTSPIVLAIDDAHMLSKPTLHYLWLMASMLGLGQVKLQLVLVGQLGLERTLRAPEFAALHHAIGVTRLVQPLDDDEVEAYLDHKLHAAGGSLRQVMSSSAIDALLEQSAGIPGELDLFAGRALSLAAKLGGRRLNGHLVARAASGETSPHLGRQLSISIGIPAGIMGSLAAAGFVIFLLLPHEPSVLLSAAQRGSAAIDRAPSRGIERAPSSEALALAPRSGRAESDDSPPARQPSEQSSPSTEKAVSSAQSATESLNTTPDSNPGSGVLQPFAPKTAGQAIPASPETSSALVAPELPSTPKVSEAPDPSTLAPVERELPVHPLADASMQVKPSASSNQVGPTAPSDSGDANLASTQQGRTPTQAQAWAWGGSGLLLVAQRGDTLETLYRHIYAGVTPPSFIEVQAANPDPVHPGAQLIFPTPPGGWTSLKASRAGRSTSHNTP